MADLFFAPAEPPRGVLKLDGEDRVSFLQGLISNDMRLVGPSRGIWAALLTAQGKYLHDFFVTAFGDSLLIDGEGERIADLKRRLSMFKLRAKATIEDVSGAFEVWHGWGEDSVAAFGLAAPGDSAAVADGVVLADPRLAALGIRLLVPHGTGAALFETKGFARAEWAAWDALRISLGVPDGSRDLMPEKAILLENGFDELNGVAWDKGCYVGQELTARTKYRGLVKKRLMPVHIDGRLPAPGTIVTRPDGTEAGELKSGRGDAALALIRLDALEAGEALGTADAAIRPALPGWLHLER